MIALSIDLYSPRKHFILVYFHILSHVHPLLFLYVLESLSVFDVCVVGGREHACAMKARGRSLVGTHFPPRWRWDPPFISQGRWPRALAASPVSSAYLVATSSFMWILEIWTLSFMPLYSFPWPPLYFFSTLSLCVCLSLSLFPGYIDLKRTCFLFVD